MPRPFRSLPRDERTRSVWTAVPSLGVDLHSREWSPRGGGSTTATATATPIVLVAGLGVSSRYWVPLGLRLGERHRVLAVDLPGFGRSPPPAGAPWPAGPGPREQSAQLRAWLDARGIARATIIGHSVGGQTAADFAARYPDRVERLILADPTFERGARHMPRQLLRLFRGAFFEVPSLLPVLALEYLTAGLPRVVQQAARALREPIELDLPHVRAPALVIRGAHDPTITPAWAEFVARALPGAGLVTIDRIGHAVQFSAADVTARVVEQFLAGRLDAEGPAREIVPRLAARDPRFGAPREPISARAHAAIGFAAGLCAAALTHGVACGPRTRRTIAASCALGAASTLASDFGDGFGGGRARRVPVATHLALDMLAGAHLMVAAATRLRREPAAGRWLAAGLGALQFGVAMLTHAPTGPARWHRPPATGGGGVGRARR